VCCDELGRPLGVFVSAGQDHEAKWFGVLMDEVLAQHPACPDGCLVGDKGYNSEGIRSWCQRHGLEAVIPRFRTQSVDPDFDRETYRERNVVERLIGRLKHYRRLATRYEKRGDMYLALLLLAATLCWI
jgi:transposase